MRQSIYWKTCLTSTVALTGDVRLTALDTPFRAPETAPDPDLQNGHQGDEEEIVPALICILARVLAAVVAMKKKKR